MKIGTFIIIICVIAWLIIMFPLFFEMLPEDTQENIRTTTKDIFGMILGVTILIMYCILTLVIGIINEVKRITKNIGEKIGLWKSPEKEWWER
jgi:Na+/melibiose symporter-like transporter